MATQQLTNIDVVGDVAAWGAHFSFFYETKEDLLDTLISYCKSGLERDEFCMWIVAEPLTVKDAKDALDDAVPEMDRYLADSRLEIVSARDWFLPDGTFDGKRCTSSWYEKLNRISAGGYAGVRVTGDTTWLTKKDWNHFCDYEDGLNELIGNQRLAVLCSYPLEACGALQILDVVGTHQFVLAKRHGNWVVLETAALKRAKTELKQLNEELERRVVERSSQLVRASEALRDAQADLAHVNRVTTMGQLAASISHEVMQPISAGITSAQAALNFLRAQELDEVQDALGRVIEAGNRAAEIMARIRAMFKKAPARKEALNINETILEVVTLTHGEAMKTGVSLETRLADGLPIIQADRVQLQQVIVNLIVNALEAMRDVSGGSRQLLITTGKDVSGGVAVTVQDSGPGLNPDVGERIFDAFYTTKASGTGIGLSICRSIIEQHGGHIWSARRGRPGATIEFSLPVEDIPRVTPAS